MDSMAAGVCEEQRRLEEEQLLGSGNSDSEPDENELLQMDIDDDEATKLPKPAGMGTGNSTDPVVATGNVAGCDVLKASVEGAVGSSGTKPYEVGMQEMVATIAKSGATVIGENSHHSVAAISTTGMGTTAPAAVPPPRGLSSSKPLGVDAPATSLPSAAQCPPAGSQDGTYLAVNMYRR